MAQYLKKPTLTEQIVARMDSLSTYVEILTHDSEGNACFKTDRVLSQREFTKLAELIAKPVEKKVRKLEDELHELTFHEDMGK